MLHQHYSAVLAARKPNNPREAMRRINVFITDPANNISPAFGD